MKLPLENILYAALKIVVNQVLPIVILPYLMVRLGDRLFGLMMIAQTVSLFGVATVEYGFNLTGVRRVALLRENRPALGRLYRDINAIKLGLCLACAVLLAGGLVIAKPEPEVTLALAFGFLTVLGAAVQPNWFFMGVERFKVITFTQVLARAICLTLVFVLVTVPGDYLVALCLFFLPTLGSGVMQVFVAQRHFQGTALAEHRFEAATLRASLREGLDVYISQMAATLFASVNTLVVGWFAGAAESGRYAFAEKIMRGVAVLSTPVTEAIFPRVVGGLKSDLEATLRTLRRLLFAGVGVYGLVALISGFGFELAVSALELTRASQIGDLYQIMAIVPALIYANNLCGTQVVLGLGHARPFRNVVMGSGVLLVMWSLLLVWQWGAQGAAWALLLGELGICIGMVVLSVRVTGRRWIWR